MKNLGYVEERITGSAHGCDSRTQAHMLRFRCLRLTASVWTLSLVVVPGSGSVSVTDI